MNTDSGQPGTSESAVAPDAFAIRPRHRIRYWLAAAGLLAITAAVVFLSYRLVPGYTWSRDLRSAAAGCDQLRVRTGGLCHRWVEKETLLSELQGAAEVHRVSSSLCPAFPGVSGRCECCGDITLEFYKAGMLQVAVSVHHGEALRWPDRGGPDLRLSEAGQAVVQPWVVRAEERRHAARAADLSAARPASRPEEAR